MNTTSTFLTLQVVVSSLFLPFALRQGFFARMANEVVVGGIGSGGGIVVVVATCQVEQRSMLLQINELKHIELQF